MPPVKGSNMDKLTKFPVEYPDVAQVGGRLRIFHDTYVATALAAGSTIDIARLPKGARVWDVHIFHDDLGTVSGTLSVGDAGAAARYIAAFATGSAGKQTMTGSSGASTAVGYPFLIATILILDPSFPVERLPVLDWKELGSLLIGMLGLS